MKALILISIGIFLFFFGALICDLRWDNYIAVWDSQDPNLITTNPYRVSWYNWRFIIYGLERCFYIGALTMILTGSLRHICVIAFDFAVGNVVDRAFFNCNTYSWNDLMILIFALYYVFMTYYPMQHALITKPIKDLWHRKFKK